MGHEDAVPVRHDLLVVALKGGVARGGVIDTDEVDGQAFVALRRGNGTRAGNQHRNELSRTDHPVFPRALAVHYTTSRLLRVANRGAFRYHSGETP